MKKSICFLIIIILGIVLSACTTSKITECTCPCHNNHNTETLEETQEETLEEIPTPYRFEGLASAVQFSDWTNISLYDDSHWCPDSIKIEKISNETAKIILQYTDGYGEVTTETVIVDYSKIVFISPLEE